ncbi:MAG: glycosyltransferase [Nanoarchaeota archaeon]
MAIYEYIGYKKTFEFDRIKKPYKISKDFSIVVPSYNEDENLKPLIRELKKVMAKTKFKSSYEIIIVDDNSNGKTREILKNFAKNGNFIALLRNKKGIFTAVLDGIKIANGKYILTMDADLSHPPHLIPKMLSYINDYDIVIGSRYSKGGEMKSTFTRKWGGFFLNKICSFIIGTKVKDLGGNFRIFKKSAIDKIKFRYPCKFAEFGQELFYRAERLNFKIKEVPFIYRDRKEGKSKIGNIPIKQAIHYLKRAFQLKRENKYGAAELKDL